VLKMDRPFSLQIAHSM